VVLEAAETVGAVAAVLADERGRGGLDLRAIPASPARAPAEAVEQLAHVLRRVCDRRPVEVDDGDVARRRVDVLEREATVRRRALGSCVARVPGAERLDQRAGDLLELRPHRRGAHSPPGEPEGPFCIVLGIEIGPRAV
jgi:hypothetical protein